MRGHYRPPPSVDLRMAVRERDAASAAVLVSGKFGETGYRIRGGVEDAIINAVRMLVGEHPAIRGARHMKISGLFRHVPLGPAKRLGRVIFRPVTHRGVHGDASDPMIPAEGA